MNSDIRLSITFPHHLKQKKLRRLLGAEGVVSLIFLWCWVAAFRPSGDLSGLDTDDIAIGAGWEGDPLQFINGLIDAGFIDGGPGHYVLHDWLHHNAYAAGAEDRSEKARHAARARYAKEGNEKAPKKKPAPKAVKPEPTLSAVFEAVWQKYPNKDGKKAALTHFKASVKSAKDVEDINRALDNYLKSEKVKNGYIKNGSAWFNNWRDYLDWQEPAKENTCPASEAPPYCIGTKCGDFKNRSNPDQKERTRQHLWCDNNCGVKPKP